MRCIPWTALVSFAVSLAGCQSQDEGDNHGDSECVGDFASCIDDFWNACFDPDDTCYSSGYSSDKGAYSVWETGAWISWQSNRNSSDTGLGGWNRVYHSSGAECATAELYNDRATYVRASDGAGLTFRTLPDGSSTVFCDGREFPLGEPGVSYRFGTRCLFGSHIGQACRSDSEPEPLPE